MDGTCSSNYMLMIAFSTTKSFDVFLIRFMMSVTQSTTEITHTHTPAVQPGAKGYVFLIGFVMSVFITDPQFGALCGKSC